LAATPCRDLAGGSTQLKGYVCKLMYFLRYGHPEHIFEKTWRDTQHTYAEDNILVDIPGYTLPLSRWTTISSDDKPLSYLLLLYWTCDTVCSRVIDRTIFEEDLKSLAPPSSQPHALCFCSPFLVNALLAVSCLRSLLMWPHMKPLLTRASAVHNEPGDFSSVQRPKHTRSGNTKRAMELYTRLSEWKFSLPEPLQAENAVLLAAILLQYVSNL
jgi:hypothetical protein